MSRLPQRWTWLVACGICMLAILFVPVTIPIEDANGTPRPGSTPDSSAADARPVGAIVTGKAATQQFLSTGTRIRSISLLLSTYNRTNHGTAEAVVQAYADGQWHDLASRTIAKEGIEDNAYYTLAFTPQLTVARGEPIRLTLRSTSGPSNAITWWTNLAWQPDGYTLIYGDQPQRGTASFRVEYAASTGPLVMLVGLLWNHLTVFLDPLWQAALLMSFGLMVAGAIALSYVYIRGRSLTPGQWQRTDRLLKPRSGGAEIDRID